MLNLIALILCVVMVMRYIKKKSFEFCLLGIIITIINLPFVIQWLFN